MKFHVQEFERTEFRGENGNYKKAVCYCFTNPAHIIFSHLVCNLCHIVPKNQIIFVVTVTVILYYGFILWLQERAL